MTGCGSAIGMTEDTSALRRWMVSSPKISQLATQYELGISIKRASRDIIPKMLVERPANWDWVKKIDVWQVILTILPPIATCRSCDQLTKCGCKANVNPSENVIKPT